MHILRCSPMLSHCSSACGHFEKPLKRLSRNNHLIGNQSAQRIVSNHLCNYTKVRCTPILMSVKKCSLLFRPEMLTINIIKCPLSCTEQGKIISCIDPNLNIMLTLTHTLLFQKTAKCLQLKGHLVFDIKIRRTSNYVHF